MVREKLERLRFTFVPGSVNYRDWEDGTRVYTTDVIVDQFDFVGSNNDNAQPTATAVKPSSSPFDFVDVSGDDLPF